MNPQIDPAEYHCLIMMGRRTKIMGFYAAMFAFFFTQLKNPDELDGLTAFALVMLYLLVSLYYLITQNRFFARRFAVAAAQIQNESVRKQLQCENAFRRIAHGIFILITVLYIAYLGVY